MCMVQKISVPDKWSEEDSVCALRRQSRDGRDAPAVAQPMSLPRKKQEVQGDSPRAEVQLGVGYLTPEHPSSFQ